MKIAFNIFIPRDTKTPPFKAGITRCAAWELAVLTPKPLGRGFIGGFILLLLFVSFSGYCLPVDNSFEQLKIELKQEGISNEFVKTTENSVKRMISSSAPIADIKPVLLDLWNDGVRGRALKNAVAAVAELIASGDNAKDAAEIASGAAHKAESEGLGGFGIGMRVKKAVQDRKAYLKALKK
ncbi:MAG: hypothetical protein M0R20_06460 [Candidatus Omnitrophica bacterium]|jgi:hypothetical protein|nr:hypothetical protein [Candidatus Omnitrophota bacterium]